MLSRYRAGFPEQCWRDAGGLSRLGRKVSQVELQWSYEYVPVLRELAYLRRQRRNG